MAVTVHPNENIDSALRRLHREVLREKILETYRNKQYHIPKADEDRAKRREWRKMKRRRNAANRRAK